MRTERSVEIEITPAMMAEAFWSAGSDGQALFFKEHHRVVTESHKTNPSANSLGEMQWCYMKEDIRALGPEAWNMYLSFCAFAYEFFERKPEMTEWQP
jgi:hypothetical protein